MTATNIRQVKLDRLAGEIAPTLRERGSLVVDADTIEDVDLWRAAARKAGRILGWRVRTGVNDHGVLWAASDDYPVTLEDMRRAMNRLDSYLNSPRATETGERAILGVVTDSGGVRPRRPRGR